MALAVQGVPEGVQPPVVTPLSASSLHVSWSEPAHPHGIIRQYHLNQTGVGTIFTHKDGSRNYTVTGKILSFLSITILPPRFLKPSDSSLSVTIWVLLHVFPPQETKTSAETHSVWGLCREGWPVIIMYSTSAPFVALHMGKHLHWPNESKCVVNIWETQILRATDKLPTSVNRIFKFGFLHLKCLKTDLYICLCEYQDGIFWSWMSVAVTTRSFALCWLGTRPGIGFASSQ